MLWFRAGLAVVALPGTVLVWVPAWLSTIDGGRFSDSFAGWVGGPLVAVGVVGLGWCVWDFAARGRGTLAPMDAPRFVVGTGLYRVVRNPMYVSVLIALAGEGLLIGSVRILGWAVAVAAAFHVFVVVYEEPTLSRSFAGDYDAYRRTVPRWLPRLRPRRRTRGAGEEQPIADD